MKSSMPWGKRFLALLVLGGLLSGISGCGQTPAPSIQPEAPEPSAWGITAPPEPSLMQSVVSAAEPEASAEEQSEMSVPESSVEEFAEPLEPQKTPITESAEAPETTDTAEPQEETEEGMLPSAVIRQAVLDYGLDSDSASAQALESINTVYTDALTEEQKNGVLVFFFEGAGDNSDPMLREDALCVVVWQGEILYLNRASTTIPDYPFTAWKNYGYPVPTLKSGVYAFDTQNHHGQYAALRVLNDQVLRFRSPTDYYEDVSYRQSIEIHRRAVEGVAPADASWANSVGCLLVGHAGTGYDDDYTGFARAVGIISPEDSGNTRYRTQVHGTLIVDRSFAGDYLLSVGYSENAVTALGSGVM